MSKNKNYSLGASSPIAATVAFALGKKEAVEDSLKLSRETAQKDYRFHTPALENDKGEDTLRHILGGGFLSEGEDDNFFEKTGAKVATALYNYKERNVNSPTRAGMESSIDLNNNIYGALLKKKYPNKEDFFKEAKNIVAALGREDPDIIRQNYSIPYTDKEGNKKVAYPVLSTGSYTETEGKQPLPFMSDGGLTMNKQMELFEEGGQVDPVSGNDVPLGSTEKEVRDDQPAMLSEGEMVVPADVVRYFGVEHFMKLRDEAKMGYKKMEAMGQFGTEEGQTLPDDTLFNAGGPPFTIEDIEVIEPDDLENLEGGEEEIEAANGALVRNFAEGGMTTYTERMIGGNANPATQQAPLQPLVPDIGRVASVPVPGGLGQLVGSTGFGANTERFFMDPTGAISSIFFFDGMPQQEVDEDLIELDSPFELRSYAELGGGVSTVADKEEKEEEEELAGDGGDDDNSTGSAEYGSFGDMAEQFGQEFGFQDDEDDKGPEGGGGGAGGGPDSDGCVIATHAVSYGVFTQTEKAKAVIWCKQNLHNTWYGEAFRRGYRWHGNRAIAKGVKPTHYKEFNSFVNFVTGKKRTLKGSLIVCKRAVQFFVTGLFVKG